MFRLAISMSVIAGALLTVLVAVLFSQPAAPAPKHTRPRLEIPGIPDTVSTNGHTMIVCKARGSQADGTPLDSSRPPKPGDLYVQTCRGYKATDPTVG